MGFDLSPSVGLRRWKWLSDDRTKSSGNLLELHRDGSIALSIDVDAEFIDQDSAAAANASLRWRPTTTSLAVEFAIAKLGAFLATGAQNLENNGDYEIRVGLVWNQDFNGLRPIQVFSSYDRAQHDPEPLTIYRFTPIEGTVAAGSPEMLRQSLFSLTTDVLNQMGIARINMLRHV
ncbi:hypothetical protein [Arthrobacter sp. TMS2-4]